MIKVVDNTAFLVVKRAVLNTKEGIRKGLLDVAPEIQKEVRRLIFSPPKTGRLYVIGGQIHQASAPGEAPANLTGILAASVAFEVASSTRLAIGYREEIAPYGRYLEGIEKSRILPRPALRPGALGKAREVEQAVLRGVARELHRVH